MYILKNMRPEILGPHVTGDGVLVQCFFPGADKVTVKTTKDGREYPMSKEDDAGYFAVLLSGRKTPGVYSIWWSGGGADRML